MLKVTHRSLKSAPVLKFPFERIPRFYKPEFAVVEAQPGFRHMLFKICYLKRPEGQPFGIYGAKSEARVAALPHVLSKLSSYCRAMGLRPHGCDRYIDHLIYFLNWADTSAHAGRYETVLSDAELALRALEDYNGCLKLLVQAGKLHINTAGDRALTTRTILSLIHEREYADEVEVLVPSGSAGTPTVAPEPVDVRMLLSTLAKTFDLCNDIVANPESDSARERTFRVGQGDSERDLILRSDADHWVALDLACMSFAVLAIGDSGANLAQIAHLRYSDELYQQLRNADTVTMRFKEIKFRARDKEVPVHFTPVVRRRFPAYLRLRERLLDTFPNERLDELVFLRVKLASPMDGGALVGATDVVGLLDALRTRFKTWFGAEIPKITLRQLRLHVGNKFTEIAGPKVSADRLGHTLLTAIRNYNNGSASRRNSELTDFFSSVVKSAIEAARKPGIVSRGEVDLATGVCKDRGHPEKLNAAPTNIEPDCRKTEGCLFCDKFRVHADETDIRKLLSCQYVMNRLALIRGSARQVEATYYAIMARIQTLLDELRQRVPDIYGAVDIDVRCNQNLSPYWAARFNQLCLLGLVSHPRAPAQDAAP
ncbi:hypothetical protein [Paraburkholderia azotifigens]|uniref:Integrase n=1 Tax=Paraburkholderia azotifigens TaxID=2057004 RepID=A0ABU9R992_9BURK